MKKKDMEKARYAVSLELEKEKINGQNTGREFVRITGAVDLRTNEAPPYNMFVCEGPWVGEIKHHPEQHAIDTINLRAFTHDVCETFKETGKQIKKESVIKWGPEINRNGRKIKLATVFVFDVSDK